MINPKTNEKKSIEVGASRLKKIFYTNARTAYAQSEARAGYKLPLSEYIRYVAILDNHTRHTHAQMHGKIAHRDDKFWEKNYPPNGWNCRCAVEFISKDEMDEQGFKEMSEIEKTLNFAEKDWDYDTRNLEKNDNALQLIIENKLKKYVKNPIAKQELLKTMHLMQEGRKAWAVVNELKKAKKDITMALCAVPKDLQGFFGTKAPVLQMSSEQLKKHLDKHDYIKLFDYALAPYLLNNSTLEVWQDENPQNPNKYLLISKFGVWYRMSVKNLNEENELFFENLLKGEKEKLTHTIKRDFGVEMKTQCKKSSTYTQSFSGLGESRAISLRFRVNFNKFKKQSQGGLKMKVWCLFEQSGTFKNVFKEFGFEAYDCDILNDFNQTDFQVDLFADILNEFEYIELCKRRKEKDLSPVEIPKNIVDYPRTIFNEISKDDLVFAFFPCIKFTEKCFLNTKCKNSSMKNYTATQKLAYSRQSVNEIARYYDTLCKLCEIATHKGFKLIIENPNSQPHFMSLFFPFEPSITIKDRAKMCDYFKKPTNFWFFNCEPQNNFILQNYGTKGRCLNMNGSKASEKHKDKNELLRWFEKEHGLKISNIQKARSMISPEFARNFIKAFVLKDEQKSFKKAFCFVRCTRNETSLRGKAV